MEENNFELNIKTKDNQKYEIPVEGSLAILALGDIGLLAWRKKKEEYLQKLMAEQNPNS